jgi:hypothetical protein
VTAVASVGISREVRMNRLRHVAKQFPYGIRGESRQRFRWLRRGAGGHLGVGEPLLENAQFRFGKIQLEAIEFLVQQPNFLTVTNPERLVRRPRAGNVGAPLAETAFHLRQSRAKTVEIVILMAFRRDERAHLHTIIPNARLAILFSSICSINS